MFGLANRLQPFALLGGEDLIEFRSRCLRQGGCLLLPIVNLDEQLPDRRGVGTGGLEQFSQSRLLDLQCFGDRADGCVSTLDHIHQRLGLCFRKSQYVGHNRDGWGKLALVRARWSGLEDHQDQQSCGKAGFSHGTLLLLFGAPRGHSI